MTSPHPKLLEDSHLLGNAGNGILLLHRNALVPWLILVPETDAVELHELDSALYHQLMSEVRRLGKFILRHFDCEHINIASIGNIVPQLHIHIIGRHANDACWPQPVWGHLGERAEYSPQQLDELQAHLLTERILRNQLAS